MKTLTLLLISLTEFFLAMRVIWHYSKSFSLPEFMANAPVDKFIYVRWHMLMGWITLQSATIVSMLK